MGAADQPIYSRDTAEITWEFSRQHRRTTGSLQVRGGVVRVILDPKLDLSVHAFT